MGEKRKRSTTVQVRNHTPKRQSPTPHPQHEKNLEPEIPTFFTRDGPLPVTSNPQPEDLPLRDFKSVAESKMLAESLARSQRKWVDGDIFEKFWIKPLKSRKLDPAVLEKNPGKECMVKLGNAQLHIVPHKFDIRLFQVLRPIQEPPSHPPPSPHLPPPQSQQHCFSPTVSQQGGHLSHFQASAPTPQGLGPSLIQNSQSQPQTSPTAPIQHPYHSTSPPSTQTQNAIRQPILQQQEQQQSLPALYPVAQVYPHSVQAQPLAPQHSRVPAEGASDSTTRPRPSQTETSTTRQLPHPQAAIRPQGPSGLVQGGPEAATLLISPQPMHQQTSQQAPQSIQQRPFVQQSQSFGNVGPPSQPDPPRPDPVIQMLAMKAATDVKLKELMRIVASGKATREQLQEFQGYIDTLTAASNNPPIGPPGSQSRPGGPPPLVQQSQPQRQQIHPQPQPQQQMHHQTHPMHQNQHTNPQYPTHTQQHQMYQHPHNQHLQQNYRQNPQPLPVQQRTQPQPKVRTIPQPPKHETVGIVFEFLDSYSQGDRFLFPKFAILEYLNRGTTVKASFIVTRKPLGLIDEHYQPITIALQCHYPRVLEHLKMIVADPDATRNHIKQIMENTKRVDNSFLVYRLRRESGEVVPDKAIVEARMDPPPRFKNRREPVTPMQDVKGCGSSTTQPRSTGPKVKHVKKYIPSNSTYAAMPDGYPTATGDFVHADSAPTSSPFPRPRRIHKPPRSRKGRIADPTKSCHICKTSKTSLWRKAEIEGDLVTVCNACGIKWKTNTQKQVQIANAVANGLPIPTFEERWKRTDEIADGSFPEEMVDDGMYSEVMEGVESVTGQVFPTRRVLEGLNPEIPQGIITDKTNSTISISERPFVTEPPIIQQPPHSQSPAIIGSASTTTPPNAAHIVMGPTS